jgi:hypothetical protein
LKKKYFSSHKLPKQQSTCFWSQGILGFNQGRNLQSNSSTSSSVGGEQDVAIGLALNKGSFYQ